MTFLARAVLSSKLGQLLEGLLQSWDALVTLGMNEGALRKWMLNVASI
jgi:hypothetical protein